MKGHFLLLFLLVNVGAQNSLEKLREKIAALKRENDEFQESLDMIAANLNNQSSKCEKESKQKEPVHDDEQFEDRLTALEERLTAIKNFLTNGKKSDADLRSKSREVINDMKGKVIKVDETIEELRSNVAKSLEGFENEIEEVKKIANIIVNSEGTVMYGHVGSACTTFGQECTDDQSECRSGRCQCLPGLSYNLHKRKCVASCDMYGSTYQVVSKKIIRGHNNIHLNSTNLAKCKTACETASEFQCRSIDYFSEWKQCFMSEKVVSDVPDDSWEYNKEGIHLQRDCA
ncbi:hypothetical protein ACF0H5_018265 [Mactra antiquata]